MRLLHQRRCVGGILLISRALDSRCPCPIPLPTNIFLCFLRFPGLEVPLDSATLGYNQGPRFLPKPCLASPLFRMINLSVIHVTKTLTRTHTQQIIFEGEEKRGRPDIGDVVRIHYTCALQEDGGSGSRRRRGGAGPGAVSREEGGTVIESSRKNRRRPLEFVVGAEQVVKGIDRSIRQMLFGERARVFVTPLYAYGDKGHPPTIPPNAALVFDVNLLDFWPRPRWQKPLVQVLADPYRETPYAPRTGAGAGGGVGGGGGGGGGGGAENSSADGSSIAASGGSDGLQGTGKKPRDYPYGKVGRN